MNKVFVLHADIGAAKNIVKNICLLDESIHFPVPLRGLSRLDFLLTYLYPTDYEDWFKCEYVLKGYEKYGIRMELGDPRVEGIIPPNTKLSNVLENKHFILDQMDFGTALDLHRQNYCEVLGIMPYTTLGLNWQIRAYTMKYGASRMFNFTFPDESNIEKFKKLHGERSWVLANLANFYDKVRERRLILYKSNIKCIPLECIIFPNRWEELFNALEDFFNITIPRNEAKILISQWASLHWKTNETNEWEYKNIFKNFRDREVLDSLYKCSTDWLGDVKK